MSLSGGKRRDTKRDSTERRYLMARKMSPIQQVAGVVGAVFLLVGIAGFIPGVTTNLYSGLPFAGHEASAELLGIFKVSVLHNLVHILFGVAGLALSRSFGGARAFLLGGGAIYLVLWLYGLVIDQASAVNFVPINTADNWLHFVLGIAMVGLGLALGRERPAGRPAGEAA
jgi:MFS-type transporter involved in bile tolerance (Atg22 family)